MRGVGRQAHQAALGPYARSVPDTPENAIAAYFPGAGQVDLVGTSAYNFGTVSGLAWTDPDALFEDAYRQISALAPKPFWIAETGSSAKGGSREKWICELARSQTSIPALAGWCGSTSATATATSGSAPRRARAGRPSRPSRGGPAGEPAPGAAAAPAAAAPARRPAAPRPR